MQKTRVGRRRPPRAPAVFRCRRRATRRGRCRTGALPAASRSARLTDSSQDHYSPSDMSVSAQAIADREAEIERLQPEIKTLADVERLLGASAAPPARARRSSRLRTAAAATAESKSDAKPPRKRRPMSPLPLLQVVDGRRSRSANTGGPEQLVVGRGRKSGRSVSTPWGRGGQRASTTEISPSTSLSSPPRGVRGTPGWPVNRSPVYWSPRLSPRRRRSPNRLERRRECPPRRCA